MCSRLKRRSLGTQLQSKNLCRRFAREPISKRILLTRLPNKRILAAFGSVVSVTQNPFIQIEQKVRNERQNLMPGFILNF